MAAPFKEWINPESVGLLAREIGGQSPGFPVARFVSEAVGGLDALELKDRVRHVAAVLRRHLPSHWPAAVEVLVAGLPTPLPDGREVTGGMRLWPMLHCVEAYGVDHPELSLPALREMTRRFSAEFAIRPYLVAHPALTWATLERWVTDPDLHVRRLVSEGSRPRLPWGARLGDTPVGRGLPLCERLVDDPELYVRRSVANHLNDVCKDDPELALQTAARWLAPGTEHRVWIVRHGLRTLLKAGDARALALFGFGPPKIEVRGPTLAPDRVDFGGSVALAVELVNTAREAQGLQVEWVVHYQRSRGMSAKVFRGPQRTLAPGERWSIGKKLAMRPVTTRKHYPGMHRVEVQVNGEVVGGAGFELVGGDG